jgi:hypothetical protein
MNARAFLIRELGYDLPNSLGVRICGLLDKYLKENNMTKTVTVAKGPAGHWYEKKVGKSYEVLEYSETHEAYLVKVDGYPNGRFIYERDCDITTWNMKEDAEEFMTIEKEKESFSVPDHYDNEHGSLYLFAEQQGLNAWEFDIVKRIVRCREKGQFKEDLEKTKLVIDLYLKEYEL